MSPKAVKIKDGIYWVGAIDWSIRNFHGYLTPRGTTYNAYLILDTKITLIDTVKSTLVDEMMQRISSVVDLSRIECVISNHVEMDHSGGLPRLMERLPNAALYASQSGASGLKNHFHLDWEVSVVKTGDSLSLGARTLQFVTTPMVHWPDNMVSYCPEEKTLFSNDAFGQHYASSRRFDDAIELGIALEEAQKYFGNIVLPYTAQVNKALGALDGLPLEMIAPSHGIVWRSHVKEILAKYAQWSHNAPREEAIIVYDTMWESTKAIALAIGDGFESRNIPATLLPLRANHNSDIMTQVVTSKYICVGSPTLNNNMLPTVASFLTYLRGLSPGARVGLAFGSYGWGGQSIEQVNQMLEQCKFTVWEPFRVKYVPERATLEQITESVISRLS